uniref:Uncharacterized protein n=1 Tax=Arion vulgaris TaxID=1028688 RepID=A0A0B7A7Z3_9EUPU
MESESEVTDTPLLATTSEAEREESGTCCWWKHLGCCYLPALFSCTETTEHKRKALVSKNGSYRVYADGLGEHRSKFLADIYITLIDLEWRCIMLSLFSTFLGTFFIFGFCWWLMAFTNGDFDNLDNSNHTFCLQGVTSFAGIFLFSMETQTTIGYGMVYPNAHCTATVPLMFIQVVVGLFLETLMLGAIFVKIARPKYRANTILFSRDAVINQQNGKLVLQIRVGDIRRSQLVGSSITGMVIRHFTTNEGASYPLYQYNCHFIANGMTDRVCLLWPVILTHIIDENSPLYDIRPGDSQINFEIILYLTGTVESTGDMCQARTSFLPKEILWGHRFEEIEEYDTAQQEWQINFSRFNETSYCQKIVHSVKEQD